MNSSAYIFDSENELYFQSSHIEDSDAVLDYLKRLSVSLPEKDFNKNFHLINNKLYTISKKLILAEGTSYTCYQADENPLPAGSTKYGLHYANKDEMQDYYYNSFFSLTGSYDHIKNEIEGINRTRLPVIILGENGTGKNEIAARLYLDSALSSNSYITVNCELLNQRYWNYLTNNYNSPFNENGNTIFIANLQALLEQQKHQLLNLAFDTNLHKRNRLIFSYSAAENLEEDEILQRYVNYLSCFTITLPPLRKFSSNLLTAANLYLNKLNSQHSKEVIGLAPGAVDILKMYSWPQNYFQLRRVLSEMVALTESPLISAELTEQLIEKEKQLFPEKKTTAASLTTQYENMTLDEINKNIILETLEKCNGNQSKAARQLGISRTTIWRYLN